MAADAHKNFAYTTVLTAPLPANTGTSLVVQSGAGVLFPTVPFNATVWPIAANPLSTNAEIVRVTAIATDIFTIIRSQESSTARTIVVGDQIAATITVKTLTDLEANWHVDSEIPSGTQNGTNPIFTIANTPNPITSVLLFTDGYKLTNTLHYSISGTTLTFAAGNAPLAGETIRIYYRK